MSRRSRTSLFTGPGGFSLRRLLLQGARAARGSPTLGQRCDIERGITTSNSNSKHDKKYGEGTSSSNNGNKTSNGDNASTSRQNPNDGLQQQSSIQSDDGSLHGNTPVNCNNSKAASINSPQRSDSTSDNNFYCQICYNTPTPPNAFYTLFTCKHTACRNCLERYLKNEINESRTDIACPQCSEAMHPSDIETLLKNYSETITKYEDFMVRRFLLTDPDSRWCPAPDCSFAIIATGCASCPRIRCQRPGCGLHFCYHCKAEWHPDQTCDAARASRQSPSAQLPPGKILSPDIQHRNGDDIKPCPRCQVLIVKMADGTCNHMVCSICGSEFCWLCMKEISDLHYLSPSGCTFWGKKPWSRKKKLMWQLGTLVGAPLGIALVAGIAVPAMIIGIPVWVGKKIFTRYKSSTKHRRNCAVVGGVLASIFVSPILAGLAVAIGVPILLFYVYGVVPVSLCRAGCGVSTTRDGFKFDFDEEEENNMRNHSDGVSVDAVSRIGGTSIGEVSLSVASGSHIVGVSNKGDGPQFSVAQSLSSKNESTTALAGSITGHRLEVQADVSLSETASAVTCISEKSGNISNDTASTKALAGSILSYRQQTNDYSNVSEDGISERNRIIDIAVTDQDSQVDKASVGSCRSFRSSEKSFRDDIDSTASSSVKRLQFCTRHTKQNPVAFRTMSLDSNNGTNYIPENVKLEKQAEEEECNDSKITKLKGTDNKMFINREYVGDKPIIGTLIREIHFVEGKIYKDLKNETSNYGNLSNNNNNNNESVSSYTKSMALEETTTLEANVSPISALTTPIDEVLRSSSSTQLPLSTNTTPTNSPNASTDVSPTVTLSPDGMVDNFSSSPTNSNTFSPDGKQNPSKASILRNLFFAQKNDNTTTAVIQQSNSQHCDGDNFKNSEQSNLDESVVVNS